MKRSALHPACKVLYLVVASVTFLLPEASGQAGQGPSEGLPEGLTASDWTAIGELGEARRHAVRPAGDEFVAFNPAQQWTTRFDGRGFTTTPELGAWSWGLQLQGYGFAGRERTVGHPVRACAEGNRVAYDWDETLTEWYVNHRHGMEHGYTVHRRPFGSDEGHGSVPLSLELAIRGGLQARVGEDGRAIRFVGADGTTKVTYSGLVVYDADGHCLPARFEEVAGGVRLTVDETSARYPLTIDPIAQQAYLKASNCDDGDWFGFSVATSGDTVVVGAPREDSGAIGVDGDGDDDGQPDTGAAYVFVRDGTDWSQQAYLKASNTDPGDQFGWAVAVSGDTIAVGAPYEDSGATGVGGNDTDDSAPDSGAVFVFVRNGTSWSQQAYLKASNAEGEDFFGGQVAVSGDTVVTGAVFESSSATGVDGDQGDNSAYAAGAAYVFTRTGALWAQQAYLKASNTDASDQFGVSVSVSGDTVVISAPNEASHATGVNGDQSDNSVFLAGAAYVFVRSGTNWSQQAYLKASNPDEIDVFGYSVAVSEDTIVVGAPSEDSGTTGVNGDDTDDSALEAGAAYVFSRNGAIWTPQAYLKASNTDAGDLFGLSVSVAGDTVVVGAVSEQGGATGVGGDDTDDSSYDAGAAYAFVRSGADWTQRAYIKASNTSAFDYFGYSVAVEGETAVIGAIQLSSGGNVVGGDQESGGATMSGAAYVFDLDAPVWADLGSALAGITGDPLLDGTGTLQPVAPGSLALTNARPAAMATLFISLTSTPAPFKGGTMIPVPSILEIISTTSGSGEITLPFLWPVGIPSHTTMYFQWGIVDAAAVMGVSLSNTVRALTP